MSNKRRTSRRRTARANSSSQRAGSALLDLGTTREILDQVELAQRLASQQPEISSMMAAITQQLLAQLGETMKLGPAAVAVEPDTPKDFSGPHWVSRFPGSTQTADCNETFRAKIDSFLAAMNAAGATVRVSSTFRPPQRAYLMHWAWQIARNEISPAQVPSMQGVDISWLHLDAQGRPDLPKSRSAASQMVTEFGLVARAALISRHTQGRAIDMTISWEGSLRIGLPDGSTQNIASTPRTGMNKDLIRCGAAYGVIKAVFANDPPHWSDDGR